MSDRLEQSLAKCIFEILASLEFSDDEMINEDFALKLMESAAAEIIQLDYGSRERFVQLLAEISEHYDGEMKEYLINFPEAVGILSE